MKNLITGIIFGLFVSSNAFAGTWFMPNTSPYGLGGWDIYDANPWSGGTRFGTITPSFGGGYSLDYFSWD